MSLWSQDTLIIELTVMFINTESWSWSCSHSNDKKQVWRAALRPYWYAAVSARGRYDCKPIITVTGSKFLTHFALVFRVLIIPVLSHFIDILCKSTTQPLMGKNDQDHRRVEWKVHFTNDCCAVTFLVRNVIREKYRARALTCRRWIKSGD